MQLHPYLSFEGRCEEAVEFYRRALGAEVDMMMRNREAPEKPPPGMLPPGAENKILHTSFHIGGNMIMASDGRCSGKTNFENFGLSLSVTTEAEADRYFNALADGGKVTMPLGKTFWSPRFGMVTDRFGVCWMVNVVPAE
ncbi:MAG TPA: VOC family protein [Burkholderiaceae bacterium]|nr:VOC family protein [Burkholderiaceae bacterium]